MPIDISNVTEPRLLTLYTPSLPPSIPIPCPPSSLHIHHHPSFIIIMSSLCADDHHHHHHHHHKSLPFSKKSPLDIPPRKLLSRDMFSDEAFLHKFLPRNNLDSSDDDDEDSSDPYSSDHFRMYEFKVRRCTRSRSHDWTDCPFAHPGEKARRRDPRRFHYSATVCPDYRRASCSRGDSCHFAHGVFECWLHPARYRTEACKDANNCNRKVCFFAHTPRQLRILPPPSPSPSSADHNKFFNPTSASNNCCFFCHHCTSSPTSTLFGMSHMSPPLSPSSSPVSPPLSPVKRRPTANGMSPISRYCDRLAGCEAPSRLVNNNNNNSINNNNGLAGYKDALTELMSSLEGLNFNIEANASPSPVSATKSPNLPWLDMSLINCDDHHQHQQQQFILSPAASFGCEDQQRHQQQQQFILSPSPHNTPTTSSVPSNFSHGKLTFLSSESKVVSNDSGPSCSAPDLGWVNELLM